MFSLDLPGLASAVDDSDARLLVAHLSKEQLMDLLADNAFTAMEKMLIWIPTEGEALEEQEQMTLLPPDAKIQVDYCQSFKYPTIQIIVVQQRFKELPQFRDYFLRVLRNNFKSYQLLTSYVQQVGNILPFSIKISLGL